MPSLLSEQVVFALEHATTPRFLLTSAHESKRIGVLVCSVQPCGCEPPMICVAARKGHAIDTIIRDCGHFALCRVDPLDRLLTRKFAFEAEHASDPFDSLEVIRLCSRCPVLKRARAALDCEVVRHFDVESDHQLYIGRVLKAYVS